MRHRSIRANGLGAVEAERVAERALDDLEGWDVRVLGGGRIAVGRTYRPTWALVVAIVTSPIVGLGLLFLLVKRTTAGVVVIVEGPVGSVVTVPPLLAGEVTVALEAAFARPAPPDIIAPARVLTPNHEQWRPQEGVPDPVAPPLAVTSDGGAAPALAVAAARFTADVVTAPDPDLRGDTAAVATTVRRAVSLRFPEATLSLPWDGDAVLGRDPITDGHLRSLVVPGDNRSVSRSHLALSTRQGALTATDLQSTNGTTVTHGQECRRLQAGEATPVPAGAIVYVGDCSFEVIGG